MINRRFFLIYRVYFVHSFVGAFKKPIECGLSKKNVLIEIKNLRKIALRDFGYFSCVFI